MVQFVFDTLCLFAWDPQAADGGAPANADTAWSITDIFASPALPILMIGIVFYLMLMRPDQRKRKEQEDLLANIKKNDRVITVGGICGTVVNAAPKSTYVTIRVDDSTNTKLRVLRTAISRVGQPDETPEAETPEAPSK